MEEFKVNSIPAVEYDAAQTITLTGGNQALADQLMDMLLDSLTSASERMTIAHEKQDIDTLQAEAHKLHGGLCYVSTPQLLYLTQHLEHACKANNWELTNKIVPLFHNAVTSLINKMGNRP